MARRSIPHPGWLPAGWSFALDDGPHARQVLVVARGPAGTAIQAATALEGVRSAALYVAALCWADPDPFLPVDDEIPEQHREDWGRR